MKLIADSGSTKTDWRLLHEGKVVAAVNTIGLNPYHNTTEEIIKVLCEDLLPNLTALRTTATELHTEPVEVCRSAEVQQSNIVEVHFYGAGCSSKDKNAIVEDALHKAFPEAKLFVSHDLLGAARALCGRSPGIAAILGTGSNSCYFDGAEVVSNSPALGYVLGDEGSGSYIGKQLIKDYLYNEMPPEIKAKFEQSHSIAKDEVLHKVYKEALPNRYLASFTQWVGENIRETYCQNLVTTAFKDFFTHHVSKYKQYQQVPLHVLGSVGMHFQSQLNTVAQQHGVTVGKVIQSPIEELVAWHA